MRKPNRRVILPEMADNSKIGEVFSRSVAAMTAPIASGWSGCRAGLAITGADDQALAGLTSQPRIVAARRWLRLCQRAWRKVPQQEQKGGSVRQQSGRERNV